MSRAAPRHDGRLATLRARIAGGTYRAGSLLPAGRELAGESGVPVVTVAAGADTTNTAEVTVISSTPVQRRLVGQALRRYREQLGYQLEDAARILECDRSKVSRIETGHRGILPAELDELLTGFGVSAGERESLLALARPPGRAAWWREHAGLLPGPAVDYFQVELAATRLLVWDPLQVPELLQTPRYACALAEAGPSRPPGERGRLAALTAARQRAVLKERQPEVKVIIDEAALRRAAGGPQIMRGQLHRLAVAAGGAGGVSVQILPLSRGAHAAAAGGPATIVQFAGAPALGVVYLPRAGTGGTCLISHADLAACTRVFAALSAAALTPAESARWLRQQAGRAADAPGPHEPASGHDAGGQGEPCG